MGASHPGEASKLFEERFAAGDLDGLMDLYEDGVIFTNDQGAHEGPDAIRAVLAGYLATGASIAMNESVAFEAGELGVLLLEVVDEGEPPGFGVGCNSSIPRGRLSCLTVMHG